MLNKLMSAMGVGTSMNGKPPERDRDFGKEDVVEQLTIRDEVEDDKSES